MENIEYQNMTLRETVVRLHNDGYQISEYALRSWVRSGSIPVRHIGKKALVYYPNVLDFLQCKNGQDNLPSSPISTNGIRQIEVQNGWQKSSHPSR